MPKGIYKHPSQCGFQKGHPNYLLKHTKETKKKMKKNHAHYFKGKLGKNASRWKGGKVKQQGYWWIYKPNHLKVAGNYVKQSILVAENLLGRLLNSKELIHHIGKKDDDRPEMLYLFPSNSAHRTYEGLKNKPILKSNLL